VKNRCQNLKIGVRIGVKNLTPKGIKSEFESKCQTPI